jgi:hypothetical protein
MGTWTAAISVVPAAAVVSSTGSRRGRGLDTVRCSSSASTERQALFRRDRIAPVYDHVRAFRSPPPLCSHEISTGDCNVILTKARRCSCLPNDMLSLGQHRT